jgi:hypothetical protein
MLSEFLEDALPKKEAAKKSVCCDSRSMMVVGGGVIVLKKQYDPNQHWFEFMQGVIFEPLHQLPRPKPEYARKPKVTKFARQMPGDYKLFHYIKGRNQLCLPFPDRLKLSANQMQSVANAEFPTWDKNSDNDVPAVKYTRERKTDVEEWCLANCKGFYGIKNGEVRFQYSREYILARMMFGDS